MFHLKTKKLRANPELSYNVLFDCPNIGLGQGKDIGKQHDGSKVQDRNQRCHGRFLSNTRNVKMFHGLNFNGDISIGRMVVFIGTEQKNI